jgi:hypothetical protein
MYEFKHELEKKEKKLKLYLILYIFTTLINLIFDFTDLWTGKISILRFIFNILFYAFILYFSLKRKQCAMWLVRLVIWLNILLLVLIMISTIKSFLK